MPPKTRKKRKYDMEDPEEWLMFLHETKNELQEIVALVNQRNQELKQGLDTSKLTAQLRRRFSSIDRDLKLLRSSLTKLADQISDHEITRRRSEVDNLIDQKNDIYKTFSRPPRVKNDLFAEGAYQTKNITEYDDTKGMDNRELLALQHRVIQKQDEDLEMLGQALEKTKQVGIAIGDELDEHKRLLDNLETEVDKNQRNIKKQTKRVNQLMKQARIPCTLCFIVLLVLAVVGAFIGLMYLIFKNFLIRSQIMTHQLTSEWTQLNSLPPRCNHTVINFENTVYLYGGRSAKQPNGTSEIYTFQNNKWTELIIPKSPPPRFSHSAAEHLGYMFIFGGQNRKGFLNDLYQLDLREKVWKQIKPLGDKPSARSGHSAVMYKGSMFVFGGKYKTTPKNDFYEYCISTKTWIKEIAKPAPPPRESHAAVVFRDSMFIYGGYGYAPTSPFSSQRSSYQGDLYRFDFRTRKWSFIQQTYGVSPNKRMRTGHSGVMFGMCMYIFGGFDGRRHANILEYHVYKKVWRELEITGDEIPEERSMHAATIWNGKLFIVGGYAKDYLGDTWTVLNFWRRPVMDELGKLLKNPERDDVVFLFH